jgi:hypothetical protein
MWLPRIPIILAALLWGYLALRGFDAMSDIVAQSAHGFPSSGQRIYYLLIPVSMTLLSLALLGASLRPRWAGPTGCMASLMLLLLPAYLIPYTGGI